MILDIVKNRSWVVLLVALATCDSPQAMQSRAYMPRIQDSSGVRLIEYPDLGPMPARASSRAINPLLPQLSQYSPSTRLDSKPFLRLGGLREREEEEFDPRHFMLSVVELSSGLLVVMDRTRLLYYDRTGKLLRIAGRTGRGPGEFQQTGQICSLSGDTISVIDFVDERISLWDASGNHLATHARPGPVVYGGCHPQGHIVVRDVGIAGTMRDTVDKFVRYRLVSPSGKNVQDLGLHPGPVAGYPVPRPILIHNGERYVFGNGRTFEFRTYNTNGDLTQITRLLRQREIISDQEWDAQIQSAIPLNATAAHARATRERMLRQRPYRFPAFGTMRLDPLGRLWVSDYGSEHGWTIFDSSGIIVGRLNIGGGVNTPVGIAGIGRQFIALRTVDSDHAVYLDFYRIVR